MIDPSKLLPKAEACLQEQSWFVSLPEPLKQSLLNIPAANAYYVAFSGGLDSSLLLELTHRYLTCCQAVPVVAIHVHHGLSAYADQWQVHCERVCQRLGVQLISQRVSLGPKKGGIEEAARSARYAVFESVLTESAVLLQGHHQNDQAETVLLRLMRGAGVAGIAGIPKMRALNSAFIYRPFLDTSKSMLLQAAQAMKLDWVDDDSNECLDFDRNFIRHEVLPVLERRWVGAVSRLSMSAKHCSESAELENALAQIDLNGIIHKDFSSALSIESLTSLSMSRQKNVVRFWLKQQGLSFPGEKRFQRIWTEILPARDDAMPLIEWALGAVRRYKNALFSITREDLQAQAEFDAELIALPPLDEDLLSVYLENKKAIVFSASTIAGKEYTLSLVSSNDDQLGEGLRIRPPSEEEQVSLRFRLGGELFKPVGKAHHRPLKKWFHDCSVPPWLRDSVPLLYYNESLVAIGDFFVANGFQTALNESALEIMWE